LHFRAELAEDLDAFADFFQAAFAEDRAGGARLVHPDLGASGDVEIDGEGSILAEVSATEEFRIVRVGDV